MSETKMDEIAEKLCKALNLKFKVTREFVKISLQAAILFEKKHHDYGAANISEFGEKGCLVRASDKIKRLIKLVWNGKEAKVADESVLDTWGDLGNYAIIATLCRNGLWDKYGDEVVSEEGEVK